MPAPVKKGFFRRNNWIFTVPWPPFSLAIHNVSLYEKLIRFSKELETKVGERTLELKNKSLELSEANRALKEMNKLKTDSSGQCLS